MKIVYKIISVQKQSSRGALQGRCSPDMKQTHRRTRTQKCDVKKPLCSFIKITLMHRHAFENPQHICRTTPLRENTSGGLLLHVKKELKDINYEKFLFTVVKRNLSAIKMDKQKNKKIKNKNYKYPVIVSSSPRKALRPLQWALLLWQ